MEVGVEAVVAAGRDAGRDAAAFRAGVDRVLGEAERVSRALERAIGAGLVTRDEAASGWAVVVRAKVWEWAKEHVGQE